MRLFFAISVPLKFQKLISQVQKELSGFDGMITWVKPGQVHLTLRFLGNQPEEKLSTIMDCSKEVVSQRPKFELSDSAFKFFPSSKNPRVLLFDFQEGKKEFLDLQKRLDESLLMAGLSFKNPKVAPHLTIGRIKEKASAADRGRLALCLNNAVSKPRRFRLVDWTVKVQKIFLIQSQLTPKGPIYTRLESFPLVNA